MILRCERRPTSLGWLPDRSRRWLMSAPCNGPAGYPLALDIAASALRLDPSPLLVAAAAAVAPDWNEVRERLKPSERLAGPRWQDIQREDEELTEQFLLGALARSVAMLGPEFGVWIDNPRQQGRAGLFFTLRLLREAQATGLKVAFTCARECSKDDELAAALATAKVLTPDRAAPPTTATGTATELLLAVANHGAPIDVLLAAGADFGELERYRCYGPAEKEWAVLPADHALKVLDLTSPDARRDACARLYQAWPPDGWQYLRRASLAVKSERADLILADHRAVLYGSTAVGREHLLERYEFAARSNDPRLLICRQASMISAARLSERGGSDSFRDAIRHLKNALALETQPSAHAALLYELANRNALHRTPATLAEARRLYDLGFGMLNEIDDHRQRIRSEIVFLNGLALVEYLEQDGPAALELERRADAIAQAHRLELPEVAGWALPLLHTNTAKLLARRFNDHDGAIMHLRDAIRLARKEHREHLAIELARMLFDKGDDAGTVEVLEPFLGDPAHVSSNEREEYLARAMLAVSLVRLGRPDQVEPQLRRLLALCRGLAAGSKPTIVIQLRAVLTAARHPA